MFCSRSHFTLEKRSRRRSLPKWDLTGELNPNVNQLKVHPNFGSFETGVLSQKLDFCWHKPIEKRLLG